jgi:hypothetical protein
MTIKAPQAEQELPAGSLYLADLGFFGCQRLQQSARGEKGKRFFVTRWQPKTALYTRSGHRLDLRGLLPQQVGQVREMGAILGKHKGLAVRLRNGQSARRDRQGAARPSQESGAETGSPAQ